MILKLITISILLLSSFLTKGQKSYIRSKEGDRKLDKDKLIADCIRSFRKSRNDQVALEICQCQTDKLDRYFSNQQYRKHTSRGVIDVQKLIEEDIVFQEQIDNCVTNSGKSLLLSVQGFRNETISRCIEFIHKSSNKKLDSAKVQKFCICQTDLVKNKNLTDKEYESINNPNSILFFEVTYKCGNPFADSSGSDDSWSPSMEKDVRGPQSDTIKILTLDGMTYLKMKTGSLVLFWLFDTGATVLLITREMESILRKENIIVDSNFLGVGQYEMANGTIETCRKYRINDVRVGKYHIDNVAVAVSDKAKRIVAGKNLMNKFSSWLINNKNNTLIVNK